MNITITYNDKIKRHITIHNRDLVSLSDHLAHIIYKALVKYRKTQGKEGVGYPASFCTQMGTEEFSKEQEQKDIQAWLDALDAMIYAFESMIKEYYVPKEYVKAYERELNSIWRSYKKKGDRLGALNSPEMDAFYSKWTPYFEQQKAAVHKGLALFGEHFQSLYC